MAYLLLFEMFVMEITVTPDVFKLAQVFTISRGSRTEAKVLTVRIEKDGIIGWGECVPYARYDETLESVADQVNSLSGDIDRTSLSDMLPPGAARNAVDCALWDLSAKTAKKRVLNLLDLPAPKPEITAYTLSLGMPDAMERQAAENAFRPLKKLSLVVAKKMWHGSRPCVVVRLMRGSLWMRMRVGRQSCTKHLHLF